MPGGFKHTAGPAGTDMLPRWNLESIYPSFDSPRYRGDLERLQEKLKVLFSYLEPGFDLANGENLLALIRAYEDAGNIAENLYAYGEVYATDTRNSRALGDPVTGEEKTVTALRDLAHNPDRMIREWAELSPEEPCALMLEAQGKTYGGGLDKTKLHPHMWAVKGHYYRPSLAFYNYPYAFGLLFSPGLYARFRQEGPVFAAAYRNLLRLTGRASAEGVARSAGFGIEEENFWQDGINLIARRVGELETLQRERT
ncbi:MAG: hypothetical protein LBO80_07100 [Treponema sp.]|nr:hypothetical protein [Treponema sp.]